MSENGNKNRGIRGMFLTIMILLTTSFLMFFIIGKFNSAPAKGTTHEAQNNQSVMQQSKEIENTKPQKEKRTDGKPVGKVVYLTFDDGPSTLTGKFLDVLKENNIKATFFMQGSNLQNASYQENVKRAVKEGHYIGAHSMTHNSDKLYKNGQFVPEMKETLSLIHDITGTNPKLVRPPYGSAPGLKSEEIRNQIVEAGIKVWDWTIDSYDWKLKNNPNEIIENVKKYTKDDVEVVLMHEKAQTLAVLPEIIKFYKEKGYEFGVYNDADHFHLNFQKDHRL
ncbi:peptidoglycan/xylan/chitin deacetylase (PgdA/CDA1 family) [Bacillus thuringiensis]|uniref:Peptidoglycan/xylan/chitin deacetylase (PgdA/CDA1 family) n=2 Tax=Bacillus thuringiensis TaxID=1428 RepID=A0A4V6P556_BACTU|nr:polysaccharide deacetylase family protein [Bacillus thuringiensis]TCW52995.1 peptidoglycan/xylan/chitin deacetylase (PgdA/CDA1 family) [Bacillus thuringiensis]TCW53165.1 peptidoglycan/xylan/chitin deacetylase (PgdA/CDA1 family) [Bacillus thuringiensis]